MHEEIPWVACALPPSLTASTLSPCRVEGNSSIPTSSWPTHLPSPPAAGSPLLARKALVMADAEAGLRTRGWALMKTWQGLSSPSELLPLLAVRCSPHLSWLLELAQLSASRRVLAGRAWNVLLIKGVSLRCSVSCVSLDKGVAMVTALWKTCRSKQKMKLLLN